MSAYEFTLRRLGMAVLCILAFTLLPFGGTAAGFAEWAIRKRDTTS